MGATAGVPMCSDTKCCAEGSYFVDPNPSAEDSINVLNCSYMRHGEGTDDDMSQSDGGASPTAQMNWGIAMMQANMLREQQAKQQQLLIQQQLQQEAMVRMMAEHQMQAAAAANNVPRPQQLGSIQAPPGHLQAQQLRQQLQQQQVLLQQEQQRTQEQLRMLQLQQQQLQRHQLQEQQAQAWQTAPTMACLPSAAPGPQMQERSGARASPRGSPREAAQEWPHLLQPGPSAQVLKHDIFSPFGGDLDETLRLPQLSPGAKDLPATPRMPPRLDTPATARGDQLPTTKFVTLPMVMFDD